MDYLTTFLAIGAVCVWQAACGVSNWNTYYFDKFGHHQFHHRAGVTPVVLQNRFLPQNQELAAFQQPYLPVHSLNERQRHSGNQVFQKPNPYHGPIRVPAVLPRKFISDIPEMAAANHAHLAALTAHSLHHGLTGYHAVPEHNPYHGHSAVPVLLPSQFTANKHKFATMKKAHHAVMPGHGYSRQIPFHIFQEHRPFRGPVTFPAILPSGHIANTNDLPAGKHAHLVLSAHGHSGNLANHIMQDYKLYHQGPIVVPVVLPRGNSIQDHKVPTDNNAEPLGLAPHGYFQYQIVQEQKGPHQIPVVLPNGHLADTPEVAATKEHHLAAVSKAKADKYYSGHAEYGYGGAHGYSGSYHGYGIPVVLPSGHIADTHEVAAAKSAHLLAVAEAKADKYYSGHGQGFGYGGGFGYSGSYHGYGVPVVLPDGHVADTREVAVAKSAHLTAVVLAKAKQTQLNYNNRQRDHLLAHPNIPLFELHHSPLLVNHGHPNSWLVQ